MIGFGLISRQRLHAQFVQDVVDFVEVADAFLDEELHGKVELPRRREGVARARQKVCRIIQVGCSTMMKA